MDEDVVDLGMVSRRNERKGAIEEEPDRERSPHWLAELWRADVLAVTSMLAVLASLLEPPLGQFMQSLVMYDREFVGSVWPFAMQLGLPAVAVIAGLLGLRRSVRDDGPRWVRAAAGAGAMIGVALVAWVAAAWTLWPDQSGLMG